MANVHLSKPGMSGRSDKYACVQSSKNCYNENTEWFMGGNLCTRPLNQVTGEEGGLKALLQYSSRGRNGTQ